MNPEVIGFTFETVGKLMIAYTAIMVHHRVRRAHKINSQVFSAMRREQILGVTGIVLIILGYFIQLPSKLG